MRPRGVPFDQFLTVRTIHSFTVEIHIPTYIQSYSHYNLYFRKQQVETKPNLLSESNKYLKDLSYDRNIYHNQPLDKTKQLQVKGKSHGVLFHRITSQ